MTPCRVASVASTLLRAPCAIGLALDYGPTFSLRRTQKLGFSPKEIHSLLNLSARRNVAQVKRAAQTKLADVEARISDLQRVREGLTLLVEACPGHGQASECPILRALSTEDKHENA